MRPTDKPTVVSRTSPNSLYEATRGMTEEQKSLIRSIGFGGILKISFNENPKTLSCHLVNEYVSGNIKITKESIRDILGVPFGGKPIVTGERRKKKDTIVEYWNEQFKKLKENKKHTKPIGPASVLQEIGGKAIRDEDAKKLFVLNFLVLFATCFVEGNKLGTCNTKFLHNISSIDDVSKLDWCRYSFECLCKAGESWREGERPYFHGSVSVLILHYMDSRYGVTRKGLEWTTIKLKTEDQNLNNGEEELNLNEEVIANSLKLQYKNFVSSIQEVEELLELCSQQDPENETVIEIKKKMQIYRDAEFSRKESTEDINTFAKSLLSLKNEETWNKDTICVGPFHVRSENAPTLLETSEIGIDARYFQRTGEMENQNSENKASLITEILPVNDSDEALHNFINKDDNMAFYSDMNRVGRWGQVYKRGKRKAGENISRDPDNMKVEAEDIIVKVLETRKRVMLLGTRFMGQNSKTTVNPKLV